MTEATELMQAANEMAEANRIARYTPGMMRALRGALLTVKQLNYIEGGMKVEQARIHAEMELTAWENNEFSKL